MRSLLTEGYVKSFKRLPVEIRHAARKAYRLWKSNPAHPSLSFKKIHAGESIYSVRVAIGWRALALLEGDTYFWFWIGTHAEYDRIISEF